MGVICNYIKKLGAYFFLPPITFGGGGINVRKSWIFSMEAKKNYCAVKQGHKSVFYSWMWPPFPTLRSTHTSLYTCTVIKIYIWFFVFSFDGCWRTRLNISWTLRTKKWLWMKRQTDKTKNNKRKKQKLKKNKKTKNKKQSNKDFFICWNWNCHWS